MEAPKTYNCSVCGAGYTGQDACGDIDPAAIQSAIEAFKGTLSSEITGLYGKLEKISPDVDEAIKVQNQSFAPQLEQIGANLKSIQSDIESALDAAGLYDRALIVHDNLQVGYNNEAAAKASACAASHTPPTTTS